MKKPWRPNWIDWLSVLLAIGMTLFLLKDCAAQGTVYKPTMSVVDYNLTGKSAVSAGLWAVGRELGWSRTRAAVVAIAAPLVVGKAVAWGQGHRVPPLDILHDLAWHTLFVLPLARRRPGLLLPSVGVILLTCHQASPQLCR